MIAAARRNDGNVTAMAADLGCSRATVYSAIRRWKEVEKAVEAAGGAVEDRAQFGREKIEKAISGSMGIKTAVARRAGCSVGTIDNALQRWPELAKQLEEERESIIDLAESQLVRAVNDGEMRAILFTLETLGRNRGWTKRQEITGADGVPLLSPEVAEMIRARGLDAAEVVRQFEAMVRAAAMANNGEG